MLKCADIHNNTGDRGSSLNITVEKKVQAIGPGHVKHTNIPRSRHTMPEDCYIDPKILINHKPGHYEPHTPALTLVRQRAAT